jgi:hypothetical protein
MQFQPSAAQLLDAIAALLERAVLPAVPADLRHQARVAAHLARMVERELALGPEAVSAERQALAAVVGHDGDVGDLTAELAARLRTEDDPVELERAWDALVAIARLDLSIAKPGHDRWQGE